MKQSTCHYQLGDFPTRDPTNIIKYPTTNKTPHFTIHVNGGWVIFLQEEKFGAIQIKANF